MVFSYLGHCSSHFVERQQAARMKLQTKLAIGFKDSLALILQLESRNICVGIIKDRSEMKLEKFK